MKVKLLVDLSSYNPRFVKDAIGESDMKSYQRPNQPWRIYVDVNIGGNTLPIGFDGVECLDERYLKMKQLEKEIEQEELLSKLKAALKIYHVVGPQGGNRGIYLKEIKEGYINNLSVDSKECLEILSLCGKYKIHYERIRENEFGKLR